MGEPAPLTTSEASVLFDFARRVVQAVRDDEPAPQPRFPDGDAMPDETMIFKLAQLALAQLDYEDLIDEIRRLRNENSRLKKAGVTLRELIRKSLDSDDLVSATEASIELRRLVAP